MKPNCIFLFLFLFVGIISCKNNADVLPAQLTTYLNVVNATNDTLNYYLNGTRINNLSNLYPTGATGYLAVATLGLKTPENYQFKRPGTTTSLLNVPLMLDSNKRSSLFISGSASALQYFTTKDTLLLDTFANTSLVRFVHAAPDAGNLDLYINDTLKFSNRPFKSVTVFKLTRSGSKTIKVYKTGTSNPLTTLLYTLQISNSYTLYTQGLLNGSGASAFSVGAITNQ